MPFKMTLIKFTSTTLLVITLLSCNQSSNQSDTTSKIDTSKSPTTNSTSASNQKSDSLRNNDFENKIVDTIFHLTEVKERAAYIKQQTNGKRHLKVWVEDTPHADQKYYWIKVGEDNGSSLVSHFNFHVYPDSTRIMYYDMEGDKEITLSEWRKINGM